MAAAVEAHRDAAAEAAVADSTYRSVVRALLVGLHNFKRDLLTMGLTQQKVHDIIPDATPARPTAQTTRRVPRPTRRAERNR